MMTSIALALVLSCAKRPPMPPPEEMVSRPAVITACEGPDRVTRNLNGTELRRSTNACTVAACEGADFVRRTLDGVTVQRASFSASCMTVRCEGWDLVRRDSSGLEFERTVSRCMPRPQPRPTPQVDVLKFGLSVR